MQKQISYTNLFNRFCKRYLEWRPTGNIFQIIGQATFKFNVTFEA